VSRDSPLVNVLSKTCDKTHVHDHVFGGKRVTEAAGRWPPGLAREILRGASWALADASEELRNIAWRASHWHTSEGLLHVQNDTVVHDVARELYLRANVLTVYAGRPDSEVVSCVWPKACIRRIVMSYDCAGALTCFEDNWADEDEIESPVLDGHDIMLVVFVHATEPHVSEAYPAYRQGMQLPGYGPDGRGPGRRGRPRRTPYERPEQENLEVNLPSAQVTPDAGPPEPAEHSPQSERRGPETEQQQQQPRVGTQPSSLPERPPSQQPQSGAQPSSPPQQPRPHVPVRPLGHWRREPLEADREFGFNAKPEGCSDELWTIIKRLHLNLAHLPPDSMVRVLRKMGATPQAQSYARNLRCSVCEEIVRPALPRTSALPTATRTNEHVRIDEFEVRLSDAVAVVCIMILDDFSSYTVVQPTECVRVCDQDTVVAVIQKGWINFVGPPDVLHFDPLKSHLGEACQALARQYDILARPIPAEAHNQQGKIERRVDFFKNLFARVCEETTLTANDDPWVWANRICAAINTYTRNSGFSPNQVMWGRDPKVPTSLVNSPECIAAHSAAFEEPLAQRAEEIRAAASRAFIDYDTDKRVRLALTTYTRPLRPFAIGDLVYWYREQGTRVKSKRLMQSRGWHGPGVLVCLEGTSRAYVSHFGTLILVHPEQLRRASQDEMSIAEIEEDALDMLNDVVGRRDRHLLRSDQVGFVDMRDDEVRRTVGSGSGTTPGASHSHPPRPSPETEHRDASGVPPDGVRDPTASSSGIHRPETQAPPQPPPQPQPQPQPSASSAEAETRGVRRERPTDLDEQQRVSRRRAEQLDGIAQYRKRMRRHDHDRDSDNTDEDRDQDHHKRTRLGEAFYGLLAKKVLMSALAESPAWREKAREVKLRAKAGVRYQAFHASTSEARPLNARKPFDPNKRKGRELNPRKLPGDPAIWVAARAKEWRNWLRYDAVEIIWDKVESARIESEHPELIIPLREVLTDKADPKRGDKTYEEVPVEAKCRVVAVGFHDLEVLDGKVETSSPTLPREGLAMVLQAAASFGWTMTIGDVENGFLQGAHWDRLLYLRVPTFGFPSVTLEDGTVIPEVPKGTILRAKKAVYGTMDAPREWNAEHDQGLLDCGLVRSAIVPTLYFWFEESKEADDSDTCGTEACDADEHTIHEDTDLGAQLVEKHFGHMKLPGQRSTVAKSKRERMAMMRQHNMRLGGIVGVHVDDDLMAGNSRFYEIVVPRLRRRFVYGSWKTEGVDKLTFCGLELTRDTALDSRRQAVRVIKVSQSPYAMSLQRILIDKVRRNTPEALLTDSERSQAYSGLAKLAWLARNTRPDILFRVQLCLQKLAKGTVEILLEHNRLVGDAQRDHDTSTMFFPIPLDPEELLVLVPGDSSVGNVGESSQAGLIVLLGVKREFVETGRGSVSVLAFRSHKVRRVCKSSMAGETLAMTEGSESGDLYRALILEMLVPTFDVSRWEEFVDAIEMWRITDCRDLFDALQKPGNELEDRRLRLDVAALKQAKRTGQKDKWTSTLQMPADGLTKAKAEAALYLRKVLRTGVYELVEIESPKNTLKEEKQLIKVQRKRYYDGKYRSKAGGEKPAATTQEPLQAFIATTSTRTPLSAAVTHHAPFMVSLTLWLACLALSFGRLVLHMICPSRYHSLDSESDAESDSDDSVVSCEANVRRRACDTSVTRYLLSTNQGVFPTHHECFRMLREVGHTMRCPNCEQCGSKSFVGTNRQYIHMRCEQCMSTVLVYPFGCLSVA
jgi:hypothetical protein